jgi:hypothetical protein
VLDDIRRALDDASEHIDRTATSGWSYRFARWCARIRIAATKRGDDLLRMIGHRRIRRSIPADWDIAVIEGGSTRLGALRPPNDHRDKRLIDLTDHYYYYWTPERGGNLTLVDRSSRRALQWYPSAGEIASWEFSRPFLSSIHALMLPTQWTPVHGAVVAMNGSAIVIAGRGGAGKTTTALVCAEAGWDYFSDDFVLIGGAPCRASSLYRSARMREDMFAHLPRSMGAVTNISTDDGEVRAEVDVGRVAKVGADDTEIRAIVLPKRAGAPRAAVEPIRPGQALSALAGPTSIVLAGGQADIFKKVTDLVKNVPCYTFDPGPNLADIPSTLAALVDQRARFDPCA